MSALEIGAAVEFRGTVYYVVAVDGARVQLADDPRGAVAAWWCEAGLLIPAALCSHCEERPGTRVDTTGFPCCDRCWEPMDRCGTMADHPDWSEPVEVLRVDGDRAMIQAAGHPVEWVPLASLANLRPLPDDDDADLMDALHGRPL